MRSVQYIMVDILTNFQSFCSSGYWDTLRSRINGGFWINGGSEISVRVNKREGPNKRGVRNFGQAWYFCRVCNEVMGVKFMSNQCQLIVIINRFKIYALIIVLKLIIYLLKRLHDYSWVCFGIKLYDTFGQNSKKK